MVTTLSPNGATTLKLLVADDSLVFRRFFRDLFENTEGIEIVGEACNGLEAIDLAHHHKPDVIVLDMEMPVLDGMAALHHLMIHNPIPTIMLSTLTSEGTARAFDTLKNGAVDFICKDFIFREKHLEMYKKILITKVIAAADMSVQPVADPLSWLESEHSKTQNSGQIVFCEECGTRNIVDTENGKVPDDVRCQECGDPLVFYFSEKYQRTSFITVIGGGEGSFSNLLSIIPRLNADLGGSILVVIRAFENHVEAFCDYLDAISMIKVRRAKEGMSFEGGYCYVAAARDHLFVKPYSAQYTLAKMQKMDKGVGACDVALASVAGVFKNNSAGVLLSGAELDGIRGLATVIKKDGTPLLLDPHCCLSQLLTRTAKEKCQVQDVLLENELVQRIHKLHSTANSGFSAA